MMGFFLVSFLTHDLQEEKVFFVEPSPYPVQVPRALNVLATTTTTTGPELGFGHLTFCAEAMPCVP